MRSIWLFAGGPMQELAARTIVERGYRLILSDRDPACVCRRYASEFVEVDTFDIPGNLAAAAGLRDRFDIRGVLTAAADCHETVASVAHFLGLHHLSPEVAHRCRYKHETREALTTAGIPQPAFITARTVPEARAFCLELGRPAVLKSTNNSGSRGFTRVRSSDDVTDHDFQRALEAGTTGVVLVEECLEPIPGEISELSVETLWTNGGMRWLNWVDRIFASDLSAFPQLSSDEYSNLAAGVEVGHINPAQHSETIRRDIEQMITRAGLAIGMGRERGTHILKADIILTHAGPVILELTPRLSGGWDSSGSTPARGGDFVGGAISIALGEEITTTQWNRFFNLKHPERWVALLARVQPGARDCIGRAFAMGTALTQAEAVQAAYQGLLERNYVVSMDQP